MQACLLPRNDDKAGTSLTAGRGTVDLAIPVQAKLVCVDSRTRRVREGFGTNKEGTTPLAPPCIDPQAGLLGLTTPHLIRYEDRQKHRTKIPASILHELLRHEAQIVSTYNLRSCLYGR